jgi:hypothetical protein
MHAAIYSTTSERILKMEGRNIYIYARMQLAKLVVTDCIQKNFNFKPITE